MSSCGQNRIANGLCRNCGQCPPRENRRTCAGCADVIRVASKNRYLYQKKNKLCTYCGKRKSEYGKTRCKIHRIERNAWILKNQVRFKNRRKEASKRLYEEKKKLVMNTYGNKCSCCGEKEPKFLSMDHVDNGGTEHRRRMSGDIYRWLVKNNFPKNFRILCHNCNHGRYLNGGVCPHEVKCQNENLTESSLTA